MSWLSAACSVRDCVSVLVLIVSPCPAPTVPRTRASGLLGSCSVPWRPMTPETPMKARLAAGETLFGTFLTLGSPLAAETLGLAGFDWLLVALEHGGGDESLLLGQLLGASSAGVHALVRVESDVRGRTARALDLGVEGVMCPQVNTPEAAAAWGGAPHPGTRPGPAPFPCRARLRTPPR